MDVFRNVCTTYKNWTVFLTTEAYVIIKDTATGRVLYKKYAPKCTKIAHLQAYIDDYNKFLKEVEKMRRGELFEQSTIY